jgi:hypothetical protein
MEFVIGLISGLVIGIALMIGLFIFMSLRVGNF